ncbi:Zonadhesin [Podospora fimiseda]|uniref:Zonadhesin n=1 Tax=Podospora fimiseda TaxID=252190 RepID=A0AAN7BWW4_9PEZI|nr:Zonadhesin [Podospora fimiseda]
MHQPYTQLQSQSQTQQRDGSAYEYSIQATEDYYEEPRDGQGGINTPPPPAPPPVWRQRAIPNYKPTPLRWPFITGIIFFLFVAMALIIVADKKMPDSDTTAIILGPNPGVDPGAKPATTKPPAVRFARAIFDNSSTSSIEVTSEKIISSTTLLEDDFKITIQDVSTTTTTESSTQETSPTQETTFPSTPTRSSPPTRVAIPSGSTITGITETVILSVPSSGSRTVDSTEFNFGNVQMESSTSHPKPSISTPTTLPSGVSIIPIITTVSTFTTNITIPPSTVLFTTKTTTMKNSTYSTVSSVMTTFVSTITTVAPTTAPMSFWSSSGSQGTFFSTRTELQFFPTTVVATVPTTVGATTEVPDVGEITITSTFPSVVIPSTGEITITSFSTIFPPGGQPQSLPPDPPVVITGTEVIGGETIAVVVTKDPPPVIVVPTQEVRTQVFTQEIRTGVIEVGGSAVTNIVVITPSPGISVDVVTTVGGTPVTVVNTPNPVTAVTVVNGVERTVVQTQAPQTVVSIEGGTVTTVGVVLAPSQIGQPVTYTVVNTIGGQPVTQVLATTLAEPPYQPITYTVVRDGGGGTFVTDVIVNTPTGPPGQAITYTAVEIIGGTPVTQVIVTTPIGAPFQPITYTIATNIGGTPTVITLTPNPTTFVTTINGTPVTSVTTPPITSFTTTIGGTPTIQTIITTPTDTNLITLTLVSTSAGKLTTFTSTFSASTLLTTISGTLHTLTKTPSLSTSFLTKPGTTRTFTSTSTPPTPTSTSTPSPSVIPILKTYKWTESSIFLGTFLPPLLGVALVIPLRIIDLNVKLYQPFQSLSFSHGSPSSTSLLIQYTGFASFITSPIKTLINGHPIPFLTSLIVLLSSFMVPLATEAIGLKLHGECWTNTVNINKCGPALGVSRKPAYVLVGLLGVLIVLLVVVLGFLGRWITGVYANPWNIAGMASLGLNVYGGRGMKWESEKGVRKGLRGKRFGFGLFRGDGGGGGSRGEEENYGIILMDESGRGLGQGVIEEEGEVEEGGVDVMKNVRGGRGNHLPFMTLRYPWRIVLICFELGVLVFVIYYHAYYKGGIKDGGKLWSVMTGSLFGVRFVCAVVGVGIALCWQSFFLSVSIMTPWQIMAKQTQTAQRSILFSPSTNPFSGFYSAIKHRHLFLLCTSVAAILSEFLPVLLSNVPFSLHQTSKAATVCAVLTCLFLAVQLAVLVGSFFTRYPPMPVDPRSIAGMMYYVSQSYMLNDMEGIALLDGKQRAKKVMEAGRRYYYGVLAGGTWRRLGVDCDLLADGEYVGAAGVEQQQQQQQEVEPGNRIYEQPAMYN